MTWRPDAHSEPYLWIAAFGGHLSIGVALWLACLWLGPWGAVVGAASIYALWEVHGAWRWGLLLADSILDAVGVTFGALTAAGLWAQSWPLAAVCCASSAIIGFAGYRKRR